MQHNVFAGQSSTREVGTKFFLAFMLLGQKISFDASLAQLIFTLYVSFEHNKSNIIQIKIKSSVIPKLFFLFCF